MAMPPQPDRLILASASPRRAELLRAAGYRFKVVHPPLEEPDELHPHVDVASHAESLAFFKASSIAVDHPDATILAADTITVLGEEIFGKPADRADALRTLRALSGTLHSVITGVALLHPRSEHRLINHAVTTVRVRPLSDSTIETYLDTGQWQGKAGAYGIQDEGDPFVEKTEGSFTNVVGLPMELLAEMFREWQRVAVMAAG
ncbi:MAG TPA: Maf family protein [Phycisphaerae bacterium]|nr:Maf family protein [Phycisphaerae bacterium]